MHFVRHRLLNALAIVASAAFSVSVAHAQDTRESCTIPKSWITDGIPDPIHLAKGQFDSFCAFHLWSWNAFLWMMEQDADGVRFEKFPTQQQTIDESFDSSGNSGAPRLRLRSAKGDHAIDSVAQAGTLGLLVAQNNRAVYYSQHINPQMYQDIIGKDWNTASGLIATPDDAQFEVGDIELKAAWAVVDDDFQVPGAYTRQAEIPLLVKLPDQGITTVTVPQEPTYVQAQVALIGFHVVGWVNQHSEAIWASFSPIGIAPVAGVNAAPARAVSTTSTPFYQAGTPGADCNQEVLPVQQFDESSQTFEIATQVCQIYPNGTLPVAMGGVAANVKAIEQLNASATASLPDDNLGKSYFEVGAVWSNADDPKEPRAKINTDFQNVLVGSTVLSNPVIETFTQTDVGQDNCFACHNSLQFQPNDLGITPLHPSRLNLSHFLMQIYISTFDQTN